MANCITRHIPNTLTCLNLFSGCIACVMAFEARYEWALAFIIFSAVFDFFDGMMARALDAHSIIGKDLDSLADDVSFGVAPSLIVFSLFKEMDYSGAMESLAGVFPYLAFLLSVFSALRTRLRVVNVFTDGATILFHAVKKFKKIHTGQHKYNTDIKYLKIFL